MRLPAPTSSLSSFCVLPVWLAVVGAAGAFDLAAQQPGRAVLRTRPASAASPVIGTPDGRVVAPGQDPAGAVAAQAAAAAAADPAATAQTKLFALAKAAKFDRRPSAMLAAWAAPELKPYEPGEADDEDAEPAATPPKPPEIPDPVIPEGTSAADAQQLRDAVATRREQQQKAWEETAQKAAEQALLGKQQARRIEIFQRDVTLGHWSQVAGFVAQFDDKQQKALYEHLLQQLATTPPDPRNNGVPPQLHEKNAFTFEDVLELARIAPGGFDHELVDAVVPVLKLAIERGNVLEVWVDRCAQEVARPEAERRIERREAALILAALGEDGELLPFLPTVAEAEANDDREALNLLARSALARHAEDKRPEHLEQAWAATQAALAAGEIDDDDKADALRRAVALVPQLRDELGAEWLLESFTLRPERGMEIVATIGSEAARGFQQDPRSPADRLLGLALQKAAIEALFGSAPHLAEQWRPTLQLLAGNWIVEASWSNEYSQTTSLRPVLQRDAFGNLFYSQRQTGGGPVQAIEPDELLEARPAGDWAAALDDSLRPHLWTTIARLYLKVGEEGLAFPYIEQLAAVHPGIAKELADEFLRVWMRSHDPNRTSNTNAYMFIYGFDRRAGAIPLTRSKQERNLEELAGWVRRLRSLPLEDGVDEQLLGQAFRTAHSTAEVYQLETIEAVFGELGALDPIMLSELLSTMRTNLATIWKRPDVQEAAKTRRSQQDIEVEVEKGYATALTAAGKAMMQHGEHWALLAAMAALQHDLNNFRNEVRRRSDYAEQRLLAFEIFARAAATYVEAVPGMRVDEETTGVFETWFYGALGACDLGAIDESTVLVEGQLPEIRAALDALPADARERHVDRFANLIFTRMSAVRPQIKFRYLRGAFAIVGAEHPQAYEAKKVFDYYNDLTKEIRLVARVDGAAEVGQAPFGVFVDIEHTVEIERESGGFGKYLQNQNNMPYAYNYGRPTEDYRDKFHDAVIQALDENFDVMSVTFNADTATSIALERAGWRKTPYAYVLCKARGPQIDRVPTMKIDLDFLDTSGYVVLPVGSAPVVIDASTAAAAPRPFAELKVTQILDERRAEEGKLIVEVKAQARGLVPPLADFVELSFPGFEVGKQDGADLAVSRFTEDQRGVVSERLCLVTLQAAEGAARPGEFGFAAVTGADEAVYQRYEDADLAAVGPRVELRGDYGHGSRWWLWALIGLVVATVATTLVFFRGGRGGHDDQRPQLQMPTTLTPFTVLTLLHRIRASERLDPGQREQLAATITAIERHYFGRGEGQGPDLAAAAAEWLRRA